MIIFSPMQKLKSQDNYLKIRLPVDSIGFATKSGQMDEFMKTLFALQEKDLQKALTDAKIDKSAVWKAAICPHDDYTYVGYLYPALLSFVKAKTIILFGVCHVAKKFKVEDKIIFDDFSSWREPYGNVPVSKIREEIIAKLPEDIYLINDSVQSAEHSVEAIIPFLQYYNKDIEIVSILVPYVSYERMNEISLPLSKAIKEVIENNDMKWGKDFSMVISTDAVHYGDKDWGESNYAYFGADENGYKLAVNHELEIINTSLTGNISADKIKKFVDFTVSKENYKDYIWTWCGRYSVPFGLLTVFNLENLTNENLTGTLVKYATSIDHPHVPVSNLNMGETAPSNIHHWVGYTAIGYK